MHGDAALLSRENGIRTGCAEHVLGGNESLFDIFAAAANLEPDFSLILSVITTSLRNYLEQDGGGTPHCVTGRSGSQCPQTGYRHKQSGTGTSVTRTMCSDEIFHRPEVEETSGKQSRDGCSLLKVVESFQKLSDQFKTKVRAISRIEPGFRKEREGILGV